MFKGSSKVFQGFFLIWISLFQGQMWASSLGWGDWAWEKWSGKTARLQSTQGDAVHAAASSSALTHNDDDHKPMPLTDDDSFFSREGPASFLGVSSLDYGFCLLEDSDAPTRMQGETPQASPCVNVIFYCDPQSFSSIMNQNLQASFCGHQAVEGPKCASMIFSPNTPELYQDYLEEVSALGSPGIRNFLNYYEVHPDTVAWLWASVSLRQASHVVQMTRVYWMKEIEDRTLAIALVTTPDIARAHTVHAFLDPHTFGERLSLAKKAYRAQVWSNLSLESRLVNPLTEKHLRMSPSEFEHAYTQVSMWQPSHLMTEAALCEEELDRHVPQALLLPPVEEVRPLVQPAVIQAQAWSPTPVAILGMTGLAVAATYFFGKYSK